MATTMHEAIMPHASALPAHEKAEWGIGVMASRAIQRLIVKHHAYRRYRRTLNELEACSTRDLKDLGIYRCDIRRLAREAASANARDA